MADSSAWNLYDDADLGDLRTAHRDAVTAHKAEADRLWDAGQKRTACRHYLAAGEHSAQARAVDAELHRRACGRDREEPTAGPSVQEDDWTPGRSLIDTLFAA